MKTLTAVNLDSCICQSPVPPLTTFLVVQQALATAYLVAIELGNRDPLLAFPVAITESRHPGVGQASGSTGFATSKSRRVSSYDFGGWGIAVTFPTEQFHYPRCWMTVA
jgi:hypothetical protein